LTTLAATPAGAQPGIGGQPGMGGRPIRDTLFGPRGRGPGGTEPTTAAVPRTSGTRQALPGERLMCRNAPWPRGWIAAAYVPDGGQCPGSADGAPTAAVLVRFDLLAMHARLEVCADQPTPMGWKVVTDQPIEAAAERCPGAARGDAPPMKRIQRVY
jgi:hypothetical protein